MSSFKRKAPSKQSSLAPGTRLSPASLSTTITSTGIPSLDDILGGGLPLSCSLVVLAPDYHSAYGELVQKYFIAQGLASGHKVCVVDDEALTIVKESMWTPGSTLSTSPTKIEDGEDEASQADDKIKIAWRYEQMKRFQTTVGSTNLSADDFCFTFDLTCRIPESVVESAQTAGQLLCLGIDVQHDQDVPVRRIFQQLQDIVVGSTAAKPVRIAICALGSPQWGNLDGKDILYFLHSLRGLLRRHPYACASISFAPHICTDAWGGPGWIQKISWVADAAISMSAFGANPSLTSLFPSHHGLLQIHTLPAPHTIAPPSNRFSALRGLLSSAGGAGGTGENNLAFKCMRKRLVLETLHLDLEGGVTERRTTPSTNTIASDAGAAPGLTNAEEEQKNTFARVEVELEPIKELKIGEELPKSPDSKTVPSKIKKTKKKVAFHSDRPDLYDF
ncbi:PAXNEB-domain-containing protein [Hygrophoropsis aurantiaca]|uniref:PAXNEB-domain-containing protein n=1 Tax=Hygrophoropsis aurantiaca TaxID=72124 RepID=A0ACB8AQX6_9AGAM|nr:PAXNEB-domain-containing protein [Hygrophoropsis aurantiaca]